MIKYLLTFLLFLCTTNICYTNQPNVILIMADDLGFECMSTYGGTDYNTPNLNQMAAEGVQFNHCYSTPLCSPSRVQIMTGLYNSQNYTWFGMLDPLVHTNPNYYTFGHLFKTAGYKTCVVGKWQLQASDHTVNVLTEAYGSLVPAPNGTLPFSAGFDESLCWNVDINSAVGSRYWNPLLFQSSEGDELIQIATAGQYGPDLLVQFALNFIETNKNSPFFLYYPMVLPHGPFINPSIPSGSSVENFPAMVNKMDSIIGQIIDKVKNTPEISDNTLVIFTSDNGTDTAILSGINGSHISSMMYDNGTLIGNVTLTGGKTGSDYMGTRVPLYTYWKGAGAKGLISDAMIDFTDFMALFSDIINVTAPPNLQGHSFLSSIQTGAPSSREYVYCWYDPKWVKQTPNGRIPLPGKTKFILDHRWKYKEDMLFDRWWDYKETPDDNFNNASQPPIGSNPDSNLIKHKLNQLKNAMGGFP